MSCEVVIGSSELEDTWGMGPLELRKNLHHFFS